MLPGLPLLLNPFICLARCQCRLYELGKAITPLTAYKASENSDFYLQNCRSYKISKSSCCPHADPQQPPFPKKEQNYRHLTSQNHLHPSRCLLLTTHCRLGPRCTWYCYRTSSNCTGLLFCSLWFLCLEIGSSTCKLSKSHLRSTRNLHKWCLKVFGTWPDVSPCR